MTRNGFILMLLVTVGAIILGDAIATRYTDEGIGRTLLVAAIAAAIVYPAALLAVRYGQISKDKFDFSKLGAPRDGEGRKDRGGDQK